MSQRNPLSVLRWHSMERGLQQQLPSLAHSLGLLPYAVRIVTEHSRTADPIFNSTIGFQNYFRLHTVSCPSFFARRSLGSALLLCPTPYRTLCEF